jgi:4-carboxymuconolactone decarboxylase
LTEGERALVRVGAAMATRRKDALQDALDRARGVVPDEAIEEVILQGYLFLCFPVALNAMSMWRRISGRAPPNQSEDDFAGWEARGQVVCAEVYAGQYQRLREHVRALHPDLESWMVVEGYGKVLGRPGLDLRIRELCVAGLLAVLGTPKQLFSHLRGAINVGATPAQVEQALEVARPYMDEASNVLAGRTWERVMASRAPHAGG